MGFHLKVRELTDDCDVIGARDMKFEAAALFALQEVTEALIVDIMEEMHLAATHDKRATILEKDFRLVKGMVRNRHYPKLKQDQ